MLDEMGANAGLTPTHARAPRNERAYSSAPCTQGATHTTLAVLPTAGRAAALTGTGAADTPTVAAFVRALVVPLLRPGQILVRDNVATHKSDTVRQCGAGAGGQRRFLPASSPDRAPIEAAFAQRKALLRRAKARTSAARAAACRHAAPGPPLFHPLRRWHRSIPLRNAVRPRNRPASVGARQGSAC